MGRVRASVVVPGLASAAEALWYDQRRWPAFVDGLKHVARIEGNWPAAGSRVLWDSNPGGRGRVQERVLAYEPRTGQELAVEDEKIRGTQRVAFFPREGGVVVTLELQYELKESKPLMKLVDLLFVRRPQRESLERTLRRFATELRDDVPDPYP
jgi:Polyketide cyclase / dehydrase and lipid transport